jgi:GAF domain-containing protein
MQEALQAAVSRINYGSGESRPAASEFMGPLMTILPKLLQNAGAGEEVIDKLDTQKSDLAALREQMALLRKQCHRMLQFQEQLFAKVHEIQRQQVVAAGAVLDLAQQMGRITFVDDVASDGEDDDRYSYDEREAPPAPAMSGRMESRTRTNGSGRRQRNT